MKIRFNFISSAYRIYFGSSGSSDGVGTSATFNNPYGVAVDSSGVVYVADSGNNKIRKISCL
ncbi:MAG TPA: hypothetical protein PK079_05375 [Leptospiraceae bacterium]|nr:hypothetical protein [Leptospiraceae bacterium]HMX34009.1 hypothetical protein [Leptospiraceae bacterium]HMY31627.1 hypothetical protein [Leptospiraceae bacterium]HMZ62629.1 hypothetical protein [Leptospiraceae bacterium]HNA08002.1 hypothetical protein [Leptospiraceae bacterium]